MSVIERYLLEDAEGNTEEFIFDSYIEARDEARDRGMRVICYEYEFSDSSMLDDFTKKEDDEG